MLPSGVLCEKGGTQTVLTVVVLSAVPAVGTFDDLFDRLSPDPRVKGKQFDGGGGQPLTDAQIGVTSSQMGLTPVDFDVARWVSPSRGRTCHDPA